MTMRRAVLDLGSNSFHAMVADLADGRVRTVARKREMLHLGRALATEGSLSGQLRARTVATVADLAAFSRDHGAEQLHVVATATLRELEDGPALLADLSRAAGCEVRLLPGDEEARLSHLGACCAVATPPGPVLVLDLGGGSLEVALGESGRPTLAASVPLGVGRLSALAPDDPPTHGQLRALRGEVDRHLAPLVPSLRATPPTTVVAVGGTVRAMGRIVAAAGWRPSSVNMLAVSADRLAALRDDLLGRDVEGRLAVEGMKARRADHLHLAAAILTRAMTTLGLPGVVVSDWGLREGVLLDAHGTTRPPDPPRLRRLEVDRLRRELHPDPRPRARLVRLRDLVLDGALPRPGPAPTDRELLAHAAGLLSPEAPGDDPSEDAAGAIEHGELKGFTPDELAVLVTLARFGQAQEPDPSFPPYASLAPSDRDRARRLLTLLRQAHAQFGELEDRTPR